MPEAESVITRQATDDVSMLVDTGEGIVVHEGDGLCVVLSTNSICAASKACKSFRTASDSAIAGAISNRTLFSIQNASLRSFMHFIRHFPKFIIIECTRKEKTDKGFEKKAKKLKKHLIIFAFCVFL